MIIRKIILFFFFITPFLAHAENSLPTQVNLATLIQTCATCHGMDGNSPSSAYPKIAGQNSRYFIEQMLDFKQGKVSGRDNPVMTSIAVNLSNDDIQKLAAYYVKQKPTYGAANPSLVNLGRQIFQGGILEKGIPACSACHDPQGLGNAEAGFPRLGGQHSEYIVQQLQAYRSGTRSNDINKMMSTLAKKLSDDEIVAVASYISGLH